MTTNRAPKGIPTGGQFVASARSEPSVSLDGPRGSDRSAAEDPLWHLTTDLNGTILDRRTGQAVPDGILTDDDRSKVFDPWAAGGVRRAKQEQAEPPVGSRRSGLREDDFDELLESKPARPRNLGFMGGGRQIMDWDTDTPVDYDSLTDGEQVEVRRVAKDLGFPDPGRTGLRKTAEKVGDEISETVDAFSEVASHVMDIHRGDTPAPDVEGTFVGWGQMLPKFMRRKRS